MSYKEQLYKNALKACAEIYRKSKYDKSIDLYRSFDIINSVNDNQIANKEWLVNELLPYIDEEGKRICVLGGWYGLTAFMLRQHISKNIIIDSVDSDQYCSKAARWLNGDIKNINYITSTAEDWFFEHPKAYQLIINTSCEHMEQEDINLMIGLKRPEAFVCLQGNNYHEIQSHINTHDCLDDFVNSFNLKEIHFKNVLPSVCGKYERYMVIGK